LRQLFAWLLLVSIGFSASIAGDKPLRRYAMILALDQSPESEWLRREIERDWTKPNPEIVLSPDQQKEVRIRGSQLNAVMARLRQKFIVTIVNACPRGVRMPAICLGGKWESIDRRAFVKETDPLLTLEWYHHEHDWVVGRPEGEGDWKRYWYLGPRPYPPWLADASQDSVMYQDGVHRTANREDDAKER
jgi:hypothetical protein